MNKTNSNKIILFTLSIVILFAIPIYTIFVNSNTLKDGKEYLFKVEAFDPYDMFRGNYLNISFEEDTVRGNPVNLERDGNNVYYVEIGTHRNGFAYFKNISLTKPTHTSSYFKTTARYIDRYSNYTIETPTRYYMNENKSLNAEEIYNENIDNTYVKVRVKDGKMVIVGVYVDGILIDSID